MFNWITKPFIEWNMVDRTICCLEIGILSVLIFCLAIGLLILKDKIKDKINKKRRYKK